MSFLITAIAFVIIFSLLILIHEFGHFIVARRVGIKVEEFGFGYPPRIFGIKRKGMIYSINAIPFGGFVKLYGSDTSDKKALRSRRSFIGKSAWSRIKVVVAGAMMNLILAVMLLMIGFGVGIQPLIVNSDDLLRYINSGVVVTEPGLRVKEVLPDSWAETKGIMKGDIFLRLNGEEINDELGLKESALFEVRRGQKTFNVFYPTSPAGGQGDEGGLGVTFYQTLQLPRVFVKEVKSGSASANFGIKPGDVILSLNGRPVYFSEELENIIRTNKELRYKIWRNGDEIEIEVTKSRGPKVIISQVIEDSVADKAGFMKRDVVLSANSEKVNEPSQIQSITQSNKGKKISYQISRNGEVLDISAIVPETGYLGLMLSPVYDFRDFDMSTYNSALLSSVMEIKDVTYPWYQLPSQSFREVERLSVMTFRMFGNFLKGVVGTFTVPQEVGGAVRIAELTHGFVQEGFWSLVRFTALLSLSLAVINIFPLPALDGGRLLFIVIELIRGKRVDPKWESFVHGLGFAFLMFLLILVTYYDVLRIVVK